MKVNALLDLARVQAKIGTYLEARQTMAQAIGLARQLPIPHLLQSTLTEWAGLAEEMETDTNAAIEALEEAAVSPSISGRNYKTPGRGTEIQRRLGGIYSNLVAI